MNVVRMGFLGGTVAGLFTGIGAIDVFVIRKLSPGAVMLFVISNLAASRFPRF